MPTTTVVEAQEGLKVLREWKAEEGVVEGYKKRGKEVWPAAKAFQ